MYYCLRIVLLGSRSNFTFLLFLIEGNASYQENIALSLKGQRCSVIVLRARFSIACPKNNWKIYLLLQFLSNHPETFRKCSRDHLETICFFIILI